MKESEVRLLTRGRALASSAAAAALGTALPARAQAAAIRLGVTPQDSYAEAYYAAEFGFFQRAGLNVELVSFASGSAAAPAVSGGAIDISVSTPIQLAQAVANGVPFVIVAAASLNTPRAPGALIAVPKDSAIRAAKDLEGKDVALSTLRTLIHLALVAWLTENGADVAKVRTVEVPFPQMVAAIERGTVAAAVISDPFLSAAVSTGNVRVLADPMGAIAPTYLQGAWFTTVQYARNNPDLVKRFATVMYETGKWANAHHAQTMPVLAKYSKLAPETIASMNRAEYAERFRPAELQAVLDVGAKFGFLSRRISAAELVAR